MYGNVTRGIALNWNAMIGNTLQCHALQRGVICCGALRSGELCTNVEECNALQHACLRNHRMQCNTARATKYCNVMCDEWV